MVHHAGGRTYVGTLIPAIAPPRAMAVLLLDWRGRRDLALDHGANLARLGCTTLVADLHGDGLNPTDPDDVAPMVQRPLEHRAEGVASLSAAVAAVRVPTRGADAPWSLSPSAPARSWPWTTAAAPASRRRL